jgi:hypothetical protein
MPDPDHGRIGAACFRCFETRAEALQSIGHTPLGGGESGR